MQPDDGGLVRRGRQRVVFGTTSLDWAGRLLLGLIIGWSMVRVHPGPPRSEYSGSLQGTVGLTCRPSCPSATAFSWWFFENWSDDGSDSRKDYRIGDRLVDTIGVRPLLAFWSGEPLRPRMLRRAPANGLPRLDHRTPRRPKSGAVMRQSNAVVGTVRADHLASLICPIPAKPPGAATIPAVSQPYHAFPAPDGSRGSLTDTKLANFVFARTTRESVGHRRTPHRHGSGP